MRTPSTLIRRHPTVDICRALCSNLCAQMLLGEPDACAPRGHPGQARANNQRCLPCVFCLHPCFACFLVALCMLRTRMTANCFQHAHGPACACIQPVLHVFMSCLLPSACMHVTHTHARNLRAACWPCMYPHGSVLKRGHACHLQAIWQAYPPAWV